MLRHASNAWRLLAAARTLARHDALFPLALLPVPAWLLRASQLVSRKSAPGRPGERLARALLELGPAFVKLGQSLAVRDDLIGMAIAEDLSQLQDRLPPEPTAVIRATIEAELGRPVGELYAHFEDMSAAAASIAQVHRATTAEGEVVAVKVLRPGIEARIERDLDLLLWLAELVERFRPDLRRLRPVGTVRHLRAITRREVDLRMEASAAAELAATCADAEGFRVPKIDWRRTGRRVVTLEWVDGMPTDDRDALVAAGHDPDLILERSSKVFFNQVFRDGLFHGDMHPGNMLVDRHGDIVALDFGIMGRIDLVTRRQLASMLLGFLTRDYARVADTFFAAGFVPPDQDRGVFQQAIRAVAEPILDQPLNEISMGRVLGQLLTVAQAFEMRQQPQLVLLQKTMIVAEGVGRRLNPTVNVWQLAQPLIEDWMVANLGPQAVVQRVAGEVVEAVRVLPALLVRAEEALRNPHARVERNGGLPWWLLVLLGLALGLALG